MVRARRKTETKRTTAVPVGQAIGDLARSLGIERTLDDYRVVTSWPDIVGPQIAKVSHAVRIENRVLLVAVASSPWRAELTMMRREIMEKVNAFVGKKLVADIRFR